MAFALDLIVSLQVKFDDVPDALFYGTGAEEFTDIDLDDYTDIMEAPAQPASAPGALQTGWHDVNYVRLFCDRMRRTMRVCVRSDDDHLHDVFHHA